MARLFLLILLSAFGGVALTALDLAFWFMLGQRDLDVTNADTYIAMFMLTSPIALIVGFSMSYGLLDKHIK